MSAWKETAVVTAGDKVYELAVEIGAEAREHDGQRTVTLPYTTTDRPEAWWSRLSAAAISELPQPPAGSPRDWALT